MANSYYERINEYIARTRAVGEQVREDYDGIEAGFNKLPEHNSERTGFTASFVVVDPTQEQSPLPYHQFLTWPHAISAGGYRLLNLGSANNDSDGANLGDVKGHVYQWKENVSANNQFLRDLRDPLLSQDAVNRRYLVQYIADHISPDVPDGGIAWSAPVASGGETIITPPFVFDLASVHINGVNQEQTRGAYTISNNTIRLSQSLEAGDEVLVIVGRLTPPGNAEWQLITEDTEVRNGQNLMLDSSGGSFTVILPAGPLDGDRVMFLDVGAALSTDPVSIDGNGSDIMGVAENLELGIDQVSMGLLFAGVDYGWRLLE